MRATCACAAQHAGLTAVGRADALLQPRPPSPARVAALLLQVPAERARLLTEGLDSLAAHGLPDLDYVITLGHSPGHISIVRAPSRTMLAGDALTFVRPSMRLSNATADEGDPRVGRALSRAKRRVAPVPPRSHAAALRFCPWLCRALVPPF